MEWVREEAQRFGMQPRVTSGFRSFSTQTELWNRCVRGESRRAVKHPGCSQHEWGYAFDMVLDNPPAIMGEGIPRVPGAIARLALCAFIPQLCQMGTSTPRTVGREWIKAAVELTGLRSDGFHNQVFQGQLWNDAATAWGGLNCKVCHPRPPIAQGVGGFFQRAGLLQSLGRIFGGGRFA